MRVHVKQWSARNSNDIFGVNFHRFTEIESHANHLEIAEELGISIGEVRTLKKKLDRA
ncbi:hypothetical protein [Oceanobacillus piezotolerans]|uniref:hypothetical protein n=1 Tax=Oceanobacillus piezotolerans TaxID=2448030 RepID=UPI001656F491|nr:hypothetical protein [Oceanobacillus piezotolerans]